MLRLGRSPNVCTGAKLVFKKIHRLIALFVACTWLKTIEHNGLILSIVSSSVWPEHLPRPAPALPTVLSRRHGLLLLGEHAFGHSSGHARRHPRHHAHYGYGPRGQRQRPTATHGVHSQSTASAEVVATAADEEVSRAGRRKGFGHLSHELSHI